MSIYAIGTGEPLKKKPHISILQNCKFCNSKTFAPLTNPDCTAKFSNTKIMYGQNNEDHAFFFLF